MPRHIESRLQISCIRWFRLQYPKIDRLLFCVPNGGFRNGIEAKIMKAEGVTAGAPDCILLLAIGSFSSLCIEFKTESGRQTELQRSWQELSEQHGNKYIIVRSLDDFMNQIRTYLNQ